MMGAVFLLIGFTLGAQAAPMKKTDFFKDKTTIENPFELRDPFKAPQFRNEGPKKQGNYYTSGTGQYTNIGDGGAGSLNIYEMKVVGVMIGKERRVLIKPNPSAKKIVILKEGMKVGQDQAELKAILPGGILLVEKIINVYGQEEYLETVIPISK
jgi:hypothetical protein